MQVNELGLVPGKALKTFDVYRAHQLCGFEPSVAARLRQKGLWRPTDAGSTAAIDAGIESDAIDAAGDGSPFLVALDEGTLQIPQNWREQRHNSKKAWAAKIYGEPVTKLDEAETIIAAAVKDQEDALSAPE